MTHITVTIPQAVYQRAKRLAQQHNRPIDAIVAEALTLAEPLLAQQNIADARREKQMAEEEIAYQTMREDLLAKHAGEYVAIYRGQLIDHDQDEIALLRRLDAKYPNEVVLMRQVTAESEPILHFRSPRFVNQ